MENNNNVSENNTAFDMLAARIEGEYAEAVSIAIKECNEKIAYLATLPESEAKTMLTTGITANKDLSLEKLLTAKNDKLSKLTNSMQGIDASLDKLLTPQTIQVAAPTNSIPESKTISTGGPLKTISLNADRHNAFANINDSATTLMNDIETARNLIIGSPSVNSLLDLLADIADTALSHYLEALQQELGKQVDK